MVIVTHVENVECINVAAFPSFASRRLSCRAIPYLRGRRSGPLTSRDPARFSAAATSRSRPSAGGPPISSASSTRRP
eukprot:scaffold1466_cov249-Pinguiococcus_pyrenoidosus.AAC.2